MATYSIDQAGQWLRLVALTSREATLRGLEAAALKMVQHIQTHVIPSLVPMPVGRGTYRAAWRVERLPNGAAVVNSVDHALFIEFGVKANKVVISRKMIQALAEWVRMKGIGGRVSTSRSGQQRLTRATADEAERIAWAIAKSMQKNGIINRGEGFHVLDVAGKMAPQFIQEEVLRELRRERGT